MKDGHGERKHAPIDRREDGMTKGGEKRCEIELAGTAARLALVVAELAAIAQGHDAHQ